MNYRAILRVVLAFGVLGVTACAELSRQMPSVFAGLETEQSAKNQPDSQPVNRLAQVWMRVSRQALENGHPETAIRFAQKAVVAAPESIEPLRILAQAYSRNGDHGKAQDNFQAAIKPDSKDNSTEPRQRPESPVIGPEKISDTINPASERRAIIDQPTEPEQGTKTITGSKRPGLSPDRPSSRYRIQLAAYLDLERAEYGRQVIAKRLPGNFPRLEIFVKRRNGVNGSRVNYRLRSTELTTRSQAVAFCKAASSAGVSCLPIRQTNTAWQLVKTGSGSQAAMSGPPDKKRLASKFSAPDYGAASAKSTPSVARHDKAAGPYKIQLAAYQDLERAVLGKDILAKRLPDNFPRLHIMQRRRTSKHPARINYRVRSSELWHESRARALCNEARAAGLSCLLIRHVGGTWRSVTVQRPRDARGGRQGKRA